MDKLGTLKPFSEDVDLVSFHLIFTQILGERYRKSGQSLHDVVVEFARTYLLTDTAANERLAYDDFRKVVLDTNNLLKQNKDLSPLEINKEEDSSQIAQLFGRRAEYIVPVNVIYNNMISRGGTIADDDFKQWLINKMAKNYYGRNYSTVSFSLDFNFTDIDSRRGFTVLLLCVDHYLAIPNLKCSLRRLPKSVYDFKNSGTTVSISFTIKSRAIKEENSDKYHMKSVLHGTFYRFTGVPLIAYLVTSELESISRDPNTDLQTVVDNRTLYSMITDLRKKVTDLEGHNPQYVPGQISNLQQNLYTVMNRYHIVNTTENLDVGKLQSQIVSLQQQVLSVHKVDGSVLKPDSPPPNALSPTEEIRTHLALTSLRTKLGELTSSIQSDERRLNFYLLIANAIKTELDYFHTQFMVCVKNKDFTPLSVYVQKKNKYWSELILYATQTLYLTENTSTATDGNSPSRTSRQVNPAVWQVPLDNINVASSLNDMYNTYRNYADHWLPNIQYLDNPRVKDYLKEGGSLDNWADLITDMSVKLDSLQPSTGLSPLQVKYNMEFRQDIPRFLGKAKPSTGKKF